MDSSKILPIQIDLLKYRQKLEWKQSGNARMLKDSFRKKWVAATAEELVRQLFLLYLLEEKQFPKGRISVEKQLLWNERIMRYDALVFDREASPFMLLECKSAKVALSKKTLWQTTRYNLSVKAPYQVITNGLETFCFFIDYAQKQSYLQHSIPSYNTTT